MRPPVNTGAPHVGAKGANPPARSPSLPALGRARAAMRHTCRLTACRKENEETGYGRHWPSAMTTLPPVETYRVLHGKGKRKDRAIAAEINDGKGDGLATKDAKSAEEETEERASDRQGAATRTDRVLSGSGRQNTNF